MCSFYVKNYVILWTVSNRQPVRSGEQSDTPLSSNKFEDVENRVQLKSLLCFFLDSINSGRSPVPLPQKDSGTSLIPLGVVWFQ